MEQARGLKPTHRTAVNRMLLMAEGDRCKGAQKAQAAQGRDSGRKAENRILGRLWSLHRSRGRRGGCGPEEVRGFGLEILQAEADRAAIEVGSGLETHLEERVSHGRIVA